MHVISEEFTSVDPTGLLLTDEQKIIHTTRLVRMDIVDNMTKNGVPEKGGDIRVLNEVMNSLDSSVKDTVGMRQANEVIESSTDLSNYMLELVDMVTNKIPATRVLEMSDNDFKAQIDEASTDSKQLELSDLVGE